VEDDGNPTTTNISGSEQVDEEASRSGSVVGEARRDEAEAPRLGAWRGGIVGRVG
jgi:hypothetical protein